jgi:hypothetical protein
MSETENRYLVSVSHSVLFSSDSPLALYGHQDDQVDSFTACVLILLFKEEIGAMTIDHFLHMTYFKGIFKAINATKNLSVVITYSK